MLDRPCCLSRSPKSELGEVHIDEGTPGKREWVVLWEAYPVGVGHLGQVPWHLDPRITGALKLQLSSSLLA